MNAFCMKLILEMSALLMFLHLIGIVCHFLNFHYFSRSLFITAGQDGKILLFHITQRKPLKIFEPALKSQEGILLLPLTL